MTRQAARDARDRGIAQAASRADDATDSWCERAVALIRAYINQHRGRRQFTSEDVRDYGMKRGFPMPPHARAWGAAFKTAAGRGVIRKVGTAQSRASHCHLAYVSAWVRGGG